MPFPLFYDLDTPVTLARLIAGEAVPYIGPRGLRDFALVLSFTGGPHVADEFRNRLGARDTRPLYGHVDTDIHHPVAPQPHYRADLSYLGTYSEDRQRTLEALFVAPARARQDLRFLIGGAQYPDDFPWSPNIYFVRHLPPSEHAPFFASSRLTLNVTRRAMAEMGWCPSGRAVRGRGMRCPAAERRLARNSGLLRARRRDPDRTRRARRACRTRDAGCRAQAHGPARL
ncbi:spore maturation protein CgeB [Bradyrhizobium yuanmingense]